MKTSEALDKLLPKLLKVKMELKGVAKTSNNPYFKSKYADLNSHIDAVEDLLESNKLLLSQPTTGDSTGNYVTTRITDTESSQYIEATIKLVGETDMQKVGSAVTYARRYTLGSLLAMKAEDDDANSAAGKSKDTKNQGVAATYAANEKVTASTTPTTSASVAQPIPAARPSFRKPKPTTTAAVSTETQALANGDDI